MREARAGGLGGRRPSEGPCERKGTAMTARNRRFFAALILVGFGLVAAWASAADGDAPAGVQSFRGKTPPLIVPTEKVTLEIKSIRFTDEVEGCDGTVASVSPQQRGRYRFGVATIRIRKPAGMKLTIAAADLTLHYYHGENSEVAPTEGISTYSKTEEGERFMKLSRPAGPGWIKQTTTARCTDATEVYIEAVFAMMEPNTRECWLAVGQPTTVAPYASLGYDRGARLGDDRPILPAAGD